MSHSRGSRNRRGSGQRQGQRGSSKQGSTEEHVAYVYYDDKIGGLGIKAAKDFKAGAFILLYAGSEVEFSDIPEKHSQKCANYIMVREDALGRKFCVDARMRGNEARFLNHYCGDPNTVLRLEMTTQMNPPMPLLVVRAAKDIAQYEPLVMQYVPRGTRTEDKYWYGIEECLCSYSGPDGHIFTKEDSQHPAFRN